MKKHEKHLNLPVNQKFLESSLFKPRIVICKNRKKLKKEKIKVLKAYPESAYEVWFRRE